MASWDKSFWRSSAFKRVFRFVMLEGGGPSDFCSSGGNSRIGGHSCSNSRSLSLLSDFLAHAWYISMYSSSFLMFEAMVMPIWLKLTLFLVSILAASLRSSAAIARISSFVGTGGARGHGNQTRESEVRVALVLVT